MSPEQLFGAKVTERITLYSPGVALYQLACRRLAFDAKSMTPSMCERAEEEPVSIQSTNPVAPVRLVAIINGVLAKMIAARFPTGWEMAQALHEGDNAFVTVEVER